MPPLILPTDTEYTRLCKKLEHYESDNWSPDVILKHERLTDIVVDPCTGSGILAEAAKRRGYDVVAFDIHDWGYPDTVIQNWLECSPLPFEEFSVMMNPPFSKAVQFVKQALKLGAKRVLCYQRFSYWESATRKKFWKDFPPRRVYVLGDRGACFRHDISASWRKGRSTPTAHAWFVFDKGYTGETFLDHVWRDD